MPVIVPHPDTTARWDWACASRVFGALSRKSVWIRGQGSLDGALWGCLTINYTPKSRLIAPSMDQCL